MHKLQLKLLADHSYSPSKDENSSLEALQGEEDVERLLSLATDAYIDSRFNLSEVACDRALEREPQNPQALCIAGLLAATRGGFEIGIELLREAIERDPGSWVSWDGLATAFKETGRLVDAIEARHKALKLNPRDAHGLNELGVCYMGLGHIPEALHSLQGAVALAPEVASFHHNFGDALMQQGMTQEARKEYRRAIRLAPTIPTSHAALSRSLFAEGKTKEGFESALRAYNVDPNGVVGLFEMANALSETARHEDALEYIDRLIDLQPKSAQAHAFKGRLLQQLGRFSDAEVSICDANRLDRTWVLPYMLFVKGRTFTNADRPFLASMQYLLNEIRLTAYDEENMHYSVGKALNDLREYEQAMFHFDRANSMASVRVESSRPSFVRSNYSDVYDRMISRLGQAYFERNQGHGSQSDTPVFIVGMIRSGTTLVEQILSSHPDVCAAGELPFWMSRGSSFHQNLGENANPEEIAQLSADYLSVLNDTCPNSPLVTDKMPQNFVALGLIHTAFPNARIIHCRRNPVDTCISIYTTPFQAGPDYLHRKENIVFAYKEYQRLMDHWRDVLPSDKFMEVEYEDLIANSSKVTRRMIEFLGLEWDDSCLRHEDNPNAVRTPSFWQARQPIYRTSVERWRHYEPWLGDFKELLDPALLTSSAPSGPKMM
jgi:tetratricopeptide (TPR) repeat protein